MILIYVEYRFLLHNQYSNLPWLNLLKQALFIIKLIYRNFFISLFYFNNIFNFAFAIKYSLYINIFLSIFYFLFHIVCLFLEKTNYCILVLYQTFCLYFHRFICLNYQLFKYKNILYPPINYFYMI